MMASADCLEIPTTPYSTHSPKPVRGYFLLWVGSKVILYPYIHLQALGGWVGCRKSMAGGDKVVFTQVILLTGFFAHATHPCAFVLWGWKGGDIGLVVQLYARYPAVLLKHSPA